MTIAAPILAYNNSINIKINEAFKLKAGQDVYFPEEELKISFISVITDTRILNELNAVLNGNAVVLFIISHRGKEFEACLSTNKETKSVIIKNYRIILKDLAPYPSDSRIIFHSRYTATLLIRTIKDGVYS
ncbi:MAG TPA: hypothetical protein VMT35_18770 [Ignavibacteriaceae bacterium]|nr:hypothetical protein [Ignavibacteriaceae bacterium]